MMYFRAHLECARRAQSYLSCLQILSQVRISEVSRYQLNYWREKLASTAKASILVLPFQI